MEKVRVMCASTYCTAIRLDENNDFFFLDERVCVPETPNAIYVYYYHYYFSL